MKSQPAKQNSYCQNTTKHALDEQDFFIEESCQSKELGYYRRN